MKRSLVHQLIENSKIKKRVNGELPPVSYNKITSPNNRVNGKKDRVIDGKRGLGSEAGFKKNIPQVEKPKSKERRRMTEGSVKDMILGFMMKMTSPKWGRRLYTELKQDEPELYHRLTTKFGELLTSGRFTDRSMMDALMNDPEARSLASSVRMWASDKLPPEFSDWAAKKLDKLGGNYVPDPNYDDELDDYEDDYEDDDFHSYRESLGDNPNSKASFPFSSAKNKDEGIKKPSVKTQKVTNRIGKMGDNKKNGANPGKVKKLPAGYQGGVSVSVNKIHEGIQDIAEFLGHEIIVNDSDILEAGFPDDFSWSKFDQHYGTDDDIDSDYMDHAKDAAETVLSNNQDRLSAYRGGDKFALDDLISEMMDTAHSTYQELDPYGEVDNKELMNIVYQLLLNAGVDHLDLDKATSDDIDEMSSGGAVGTGAIASTTKPMGRTHKRSQLFATEAHGTSDEYMHVKRMLDTSNDIVDLHSAMDGAESRGKLTHNELEELQAHADRLARGFRMNTDHPDHVDAMNHASRKMGRMLMSSADLEEDWGSSDWTAAMSSMEKTIERMGGMTPESIEQAAYDVAETYYNDMGYETAEDAVDSIIAMYSRRKGLDKFFASRDIDEDDRGGFGGAGKPSRTFIQYRMRVDDMKRKGGNPSMWDSLTRTIERDTKLSQSEKQQLRGVINDNVDAPGGRGRDPDEVVNIPQNPSEWVNRFNVHAKQYGFTWKTAVGDQQVLAKAMKMFTPEEFADRVERHATHHMNGMAEGEMTVEEFIDELNPYMQEKYFLTWEEAAGDREPIERAIQNGMSPREFADWYAEKYGLDSSDSYGGWN